MSAPRGANDGVSTNSIEALHRQTRKIIKTRGHFPTEDAARKLIYLAITKAETKWKRVFNWPVALAAFKIGSPLRLGVTHR
jgi:putative transposase